MCCIRSCSSCWHFVWLALGPQAWLGMREHAHCFMCILFCAVNNFCGRRIHTQNQIARNRTRMRASLRGRTYRYGQFTLVELELLTGRTHQIRVHLSHIGHPICGDTAYGGRTVTQMDLVVNKEAVGVGDHRVYVGGHTGEGAGGGAILSRQALHAASITFAHPTQKKEVCLCARSCMTVLECIEVLCQDRTPCYA